MGSIFKISHSKDYIDKHLIKIYMIIIFVVLIVYQVICHHLLFNTNYIFNTNFIYIKYLYNNIYILLLYICY